MFKSLCRKLLQSLKQSLQLFPFGRLIFANHISIPWRRQKGTVKNVKINLNHMLKASTILHTSKSFPDTLGTPFMWQRNVLHSKSWMDHYKASHQIHQAVSHRHFQIQDRKRPKSSQRLQKYFCKLVSKFTVEWEAQAQVQLHAQLALSLREMETPFWQNWRKKRRGGGGGRWERWIKHAHQGFTKAKNLNESLKNRSFRHAQPPEKADVAQRAVGAHPCYGWGTPAHLEAHLQHGVLRQNCPTNAAMWHHNRSVTHRWTPCKHGIFSDPILHMELHWNLRYKGRTGLNFSFCQAAQWIKDTSRVDCRPMRDL